MAIEMVMDHDDILLSCEELMEKSINHLKSEFRGIRTGRASPALVEYLKVECYGTQSELRSLALISVPEPTQILIKPFDPSSIQSVKKAIDGSGLGLNPILESKQIRLMIPALSGERRKQLLASVRSMGEQAKVAIRNARRDANKRIDQAGKDKTLHLSEDQVKDTKEEVQDLLKKYEKQVDGMVEGKSTEVMES